MHNLTILSIFTELYNHWQINFRLFLSPHKEILCSLEVTLHSPNPSHTPFSLLAPGNYQSALGMDGFVHPGHFIQMKSHKMWLFMSCFFRLA